MWDQRYDSEDACQRWVETGSSGRDPGEAGMSEDRFMEVEVAGN